MTERLPSMPAYFNNIKSNKKIQPNPRTVRGGDMTWFNTCGSKIIKTNYNTCSGDIKNHMFPWGIMTDKINTPFQLEHVGNKGNCDMFQRFDLYGLNPELNRCNTGPRNSISYVDPN